MSLVEKEIKKAIEELGEGKGRYISKDFCSDYFIPYFNNEDERIEFGDIVDQIFNIYGISEYSINIEIMFENSGLTVYSFSTCWIEDGELYDILNVPIECY